MRVPFAATSLVLIVALTLALAGCGHFAPTPSAQQAAQSAYVPSSGTFASVPASQLQAPATASSDCNLDGVNGHPAGSQPLSRSGSALLSGWAADAAANAVPPGVQMVWTGAQDYAVNAATGALRTDVADVTHKPTLATSGFEVNANLSAVAAGDYGVTLLYSAAGNSLKCVTKVKLSVQ